MGRLTQRITWLKQISQYISQAYRLNEGGAD
jgi:hypothetical protein